MSTLLIINNLSVYKSPYIFCKVFTSLAVNDLSVYIIVNVELLPPLKEGRLFSELRMG
jgi:hypothetical protein